jgi:23S rRNA (cytosine1962-C5)-methyltransferase
MRLAKMSLKIVARNGILLLASCSSRVTSDEFFALNEQVLRQSGRKFQEMERHFHDIDHPIGFKEGAYLKAIYYQMD